MVNLPYELLKLPNDYLDRTKTPDHLSYTKESIITCEVIVKSYSFNRSFIVVHTSSIYGEVVLSFFQKKMIHYIKEMLPIGESKIISGKAKIYKGKVHIAHPDYMLSLDEKNLLPLLEPIYTSKKANNTKHIKKIKKLLIDIKASHSEEWISKAILKKYSWSSWYKSICKIHNPLKINQINSSKERLAFDEIVLHKLMYSLINNRKKTLHKKLSTEILDYLLSILDYELTEDQNKSLNEIIADLQSSHVNVRLLQGDVGSGKTIVALIAAIIVATNNRQVVLLAATEILARQHAKVLSSIISNLEIESAILVGSLKKKERSLTLEKILNGQVKIIVGTHAVFSADVNFQDLSFVIIDEQHKFGVLQRLSLANKGNTPDILLMSATPIPRSIAMNLHYSNKVSNIKSLPNNRKPIITAVLPKEKIDGLVLRIADYIEKNGQVFWVCNLIDSDEESRLMGVLQRFEYLKNIFHEKVVYIHGKMKDAEINKIISDFEAGLYNILVSTTVIEVGVNIPNANLMVIEDADNFGLSQIHQLRGRVGRSSEQGYCMLLYNSAITEKAKMRLETIRNNNDGFVISEIDLEIRGSGNIFGDQQSGFQNFHFFDIHNDYCFFKDVDIQVEWMRNNCSIDKIMDIAKKFNLEINQEDSLII